MNRIFVIAQNTFRETVRDKVLYNLLFFALFLVIVSILIGELSLNLEQLIIARMGMSVMLFFGALIAIFIGTGLVYKEIDKRTIYAILAKPIKRYEFILGKFLGLSTTLLVNCLAMMTGIIASMIFLNANHNLSEINWAILPAGFLIYLELLIIVSLALLFSSFSTPALSILLSIVLYMIGSMNRDLLYFTNTVQSSAVKYMVLAIYYILPNFANFDYISEVSHGHAVPIRELAGSTVYAITYISMLLIATTTIFQQRNFK
jgi:ABC-type transport system involved in multi-copper enzyme maturation permease subunit